MLYGSIVMYEVNGTHILREEHIMSLYEAFSELKFDKRMKDWNINQGFLKEKELQDHLKTLEDLSDLATPLTLVTEKQQEATSTDHIQESPVNEEQPPQVNVLPVDSSQHVFNPHTQAPQPTTPQTDVTPDRHVPLVHESFTNPPTKEPDTTNEESNENPWW